MPDKAQQIQVFAPAKINLTLHITGQRPDGYHLLDSLVVFADVGDDLVLRSDARLPLRVDGPEAGAVPTGPDNLILRVARMLKAPKNIGFHLSKELPVASGIGGGSADAAAAIRALSVGATAAHNLAEVLRLGADIPMCITSAAARVQGIGEIITPVTDLPSLHGVLVNPRRSVSTPTVFKALTHRDHPAMPDVIPTFATATDLADWLGHQRNDLEAPAMSLEPVIAQVKTALLDCAGCMLARMSGSGATCFGLFADRETSQAAAEHLGRSYPKWWVRAARLGDQGRRATPQLIRSTT